MGVIELERTPLVEAWARDEAEIYARPIHTYTSVTLGPWAVPMRMFGFPIARAAWEVFGTQYGDDVGGIGLVDPSTNVIFRRLAFDGGSRRLREGDRIAVEYCFKIIG